MTMTPAPLPEGADDLVMREPAKVEAVPLPDIDDEVAIPQHPEALKGNWWTRSIIRAALRRALGITADMQAGEQFASAMTTNAVLVSNALANRPTAAYVKQIGDALNGVANHMIGLENELAFYAHNSTELNRLRRRWQEIQRQKHAKPEPDAGVIASAGTTDVDAAAKSTEPTIEVIPIRAIRKPSDN